MRPEQRFERLKQLVQDAQRLPAEERLAFLARVCADDPELRAEAEEFLAHASRVPAAFLNAPSPGKAPPPALSPGDRVGPYEILALQGKGGMGEVYRARNTRIGLEVALKVVREEYAGDPDWVARFRREAKLLARLQHPNIAAAHDLEEANGAHFLVMEFVPGESLAKLLEKRRLSPREALELCRQVAEALEHAHERDVYHRDLKPGNVMITPDGRVKVLDFGLAKSARAAPPAPGATDEHDPQTSEGVVRGTLAYLCPEQAGGEPVEFQGGSRGETALALRDVWAFGCVLFECLAGRRAFAGNTPEVVLAAVLRGSPDWEALSAKVPARLEVLVRDCLEKDPQRRLPAIGHAARWAIDKALEELKDPRVAVVRPSPSPPPGWSGELLDLGGTACALLPRVSPDGQWLAFVVMHEGASEVGVMELNSGDWWVLTRNRSRGWVQSVCWSADATRIYFDRFFDVPVGVFSVKRNDLRPQEEKLHLEKAKCPQVLADGSLLVCKLLDDGSHRLYRHRLVSPSSQAEAVSPPIDFIPGWPAPVRALKTKNQVVFCGKLLDGKESALRRFYLLDLDTRECKALEAPDVATEYAALAVAPDDRSVYTVLPAGDLFHVARLPLGGGGPQYLLPLTTTAIGLDVDRDGLLYLDQLHRGPEVLRFAEAGGAVQRVASTSQRGYFEVNFHPVELPDGRVLLPSRVGGSTRLLAGFAGQDPMPLLEGVETAPPAAVVGERRLAFVAGSGKDRRLTVAELVDNNLRIYHNLEGVPVEGLRWLAASPDGETLYYVWARRVWAVPVGGGDSREVGPGDGVAVHPVSGDLIVHRLEREGVGLYRVDPKSPEMPKKIEVRAIDDKGLRLAPAAGCNGRAIDDKGRLLVTTTTKDSWLWRVAVLDPEGTLRPILVDFEGDLYLPGWDKDGKVLAMGHSYKSDLWRLTPRK